SYAPYGQPIGQTAPNEPGYTGKFEEPDLGIQNFGARWYDPRIGRFLAIDPAGFDPQNPQSFNRYAYANNNPYKFVDPNGESPIDAITELAPAAGRAYGAIAAYGIGVATGNDTLVQVAVDGMRDQAADNAIAVASTVNPIPGSGKLLRAAKGGEKLVIGRGADLDNPGTLGPGEFKLSWPPAGSAKSEWKMNSGLLRQEMRNMRPIRDASVGNTRGMFLNAERNLLKNTGWKLEEDTRHWIPPSK
ncbi:MAG: RHS repeat-associated core domain-containing protein, partial [Gammaproteobacteria bacterium]